MDLCNSFNLLKLFTKPTGSSDTSKILIALALTTNVNFIANCYVNISAVADHCLAVVTLKLKAANPRPFYIFTRSYKSYNPESWMSDLERVPFHIANIFDDFNEKVDVFNKLFLDKLSEHAPIDSCSYVAWPKHGREAAGDPALIQTFLMIIMTNKNYNLQHNLHEKSGEVCINTRSPATSQPLIG